MNWGKVPGSRHAGKFSCCKLRCSRTPCGRLPLSPRNQHEISALHFINKCLSFNLTNLTCFTWYSRLLRIASDSFFQNLFVRLRTHQKSSLRGIYKCFSLDLKHLSCSTWDGLLSQTRRDFFFIS